MSYYNNVKEIEKDIEILKLKNQIEEEKIKLRFHQMREDLSPKTLTRNFILGATKSFSGLKILNHFIRKRW